MIPATAEIPYYPDNDWPVPVTFRVGGALQDVTTGVFEWVVRPENGDEVAIAPAEDRTFAATGKVTFTFDFSAHSGPLRLRMRETAIFNDWMLVLTLQQAV